MRLLIPIALAVRILAAFAVLVPAAARAEEPWRVFVLNDNCPDYTWGLTEEATRQAMADLVRAHLDEMNRTDTRPEPARDRYNMAVTQEALCFLDRYPARATELALRVREGRVFVSPFLCNSLWAFQDVEGFIRTLYPARRLAAQWGVPLDAAHHIELPSLPWGVPSLLSACGIRWLSVPFYNYDGTFEGLRNPPVFEHEGPDGARVRVVMDPWLSLPYSYMQGAAALKDPAKVAAQWIPHYRELGTSHPARVVLASGTHGDLSPRSGRQAPEYADAIARLEAGASPDGPHFVNATLPLFACAVDQTAAAGAALSVVRGCFGHSWDCWPVTLAKYAAGLRAGERALLAADALLAATGRGEAEEIRAITPDRTHAEWYLAMLSDHAWNGTDEDNRRHNAALRRTWAAELNRLALHLQGRGWREAGLAPDTNAVTLFNPHAVPCGGPVELPWTGNAPALFDGPAAVPCQLTDCDGRRTLVFAAPALPGLAFRTLRVEPAPLATVAAVAGTPRTFTNACWSLGLDPAAGGITSLVHIATGRELVRPGGVLGRTVRHEEQDAPFTGLTARVTDTGPVCTRVELAGARDGVAITNRITLYAASDRLDFEFLVCLAPVSNEYQFVHEFPLLAPGARVRIETTGAVIDPRPQPAGDLLPGADTRRFAVQGFAAVADDVLAVGVAPIDAFLLRGDLPSLSFEPLGNDQNYRESSHDQNGETVFRFHYVLRAFPAAGSDAALARFARAAAQPLLARPGALRTEPADQPIRIEREGVLATCVKWADDAEPGGVIVRLRETAGRADPVPLLIPGYGRAVRCDLIERDLEPLPVRQGVVTIPIRPHGFAAVRLLR